MRRIIMNSYCKEISALFDIYESEEHLTEAEIYNRCKELINKHDFDIDYMYDINDVVHNRGYCFQFIVPEQKTKEYSNKEYEALIYNVSKSENRTAELISYLKEVNDHRLFFVSLYALKVKHLINLGILKNNEWTNSNANSNIRDLLFSSYDDENKIDICLDALKRIGLKYVDLSYMQFWLDMEFLLWTIEQADSAKGHIKVNTIKVAFCITPKEYLIRDDKKYYDSRFAKKINGYLKLIDKSALKLIKEKYKNSNEPQRLWGYSLLYNIL